MKKKFKSQYYILMGLCVLIVVILTAIAAIQMNNYENSVLSVYATQQDNYVQLVLDQINLQKDRSDTDIIDNILGALDNSNKKYWTLTKNQELLFVKDVVETNKYKGFTTATYYGGGSAGDFLSGLSLNHVIHRVIYINDSKYIASGVIFNYNNAEYKICLLTNSSVILENNSFLFTKVCMYILLAFILMLLLISVMAFSNMALKRNEVIDSQEQQIKEANIKIENLEKLIRAYNYYHTRQNVFHEALIPKFIYKINKREVVPITFARIRFESARQKKNFLEKGSLLLDDKIIRFFMEGNNDLILIFLQYDHVHAKIAVDRVAVRCEVVRIVEYNNTNYSLKGCFEQFMKDTSMKGG